MNLSFIFGDECGRGEALRNGEPIKPGLGGKGLPPLRGVRGGVNAKTPTPGRFRAPKGGV